MALPYDRFCDKLHREEWGMAGKILIVDDDLDGLKLVGLMLQGRGYQIVAAQNGLQALARAASESPDLIILDVMMPRLNGFDVLRRLESDPATAGAPVIMLSVRASEADVMHGLEQGALEYIAKPFDPWVVSAKVHLLLEELDSRGRQAYRQQLIECRRRNMQSLSRFFGAP